MADPIVGVDAGASSTTAALGYGGAVERTATGPGANATTLGVDDAADVIVRTIRTALAGARPSAVYIGASGAGRASVARALEALVGSAFPKARVRVGDDAAIALRGAVPEGPGIALIAGTGSVAYADNGRTAHRAGGMGYLIGDEGSAFAIGFAAVKLLGRALDGRARHEETAALVERVLAVASRDELIARVYDRRIDPAKIAAMAPSIVAFAGKGNRASREIVERAANDLGDLAFDVARLAELEHRPVTIVLTGGLLDARSFLTERLEARLRVDLPEAAVVHSASAPHVGALRLANALLAEVPR